MMPMIHGDGTVTVNDAASITVFHTTAQGAYAADNDPNVYQISGRTRYQASFIWLNGTPDHKFNGVVRPRFVTYWDPTNPDNMIGYIQPYFFPTNGPDPTNPTAGVVTQPPDFFVGPAGHQLNATNHYPVVSPMAQLPKTCETAQSLQNLGNGCLGTYHFTIHRIKANVPN